MRRCLPSRLPVWFLGFVLIPAFLLGAGVHQARGQEGERVLSKPGPVLEVKFPEKVEKPAEVKFPEKVEKPVEEKQSVTLDPFFLIEEEASRVRVRRFDLALEFSSPELLQQLDPRAPQLRELVYDFLVAKDRAHPGLEKKEQQQALAGLVNRYLGQEAVTAVKVDQMVLLLR